MKNFILSFLMLCAIGIFILQSTAFVQISDKTNPLSLASHRIIADSLLEKVACTAVAVGPHTLLTDAHCVLGTGHIQVDKVDVSINKWMYDESDHALLVLNTISFDYYLPIDQRLAHENEHVVAWGTSTESLIDRISSGPVNEGHFTKTEEVEDATLEDFSIKAYRGDSGAGIISDDGKVITTISLSDAEHNSGGFMLKFSPEQLAQIK